MEHKKDYQLDDFVFELVVWVCILVIVFIDIKETF